MSLYPPRSFARVVVIRRNALSRTAIGFSVCACIIGELCKREKEREMFDGDYLHFYCGRESPERLASCRFERFRVLAPWKGWALEE